MPWPRGWCRGCWVLPSWLLVVSSVALAAAFPAVLRIPRRKSGETPTLPVAIFSHRTHATFGCYACHPSVFPQAPVSFTHAEMRTGKFCARCHNERIAFAIEGADCSRCHTDAR